MPLSRTVDLPPRFACPLYGIAPDWTDSERLIAAVQAAIRGGMQALQWRPKVLAHADNLAQGQQLAAVCKATGTAFIVNDSVEHALLLDADGVHLGRGDGDWRKARAALDAGCAQAAQAGTSDAETINAGKQRTGKQGKGKLLGCSCYNDLALVRKALDAGADYIALGAMYPSRVKPQAARATPQDLLDARHLTQAHAQTRQADTRAAVVAIGGLTPDNAGLTFAAGADSLAVITALFPADDWNTADCAAHAFDTARAFFYALEHTL